MTAICFPSYDSEVEHFELWAPALDSSFGLCMLKVSWLNLCMPLIVLDGFFTGLNHHCISQVTNR